MLKHLLTLSFGLFSCIAVHAQVDTTNGFTAPGNVSKDYQKLTHYLCDNAESDQQKANLIYNWITHNIKLDVKNQRNVKKQNPTVKEVLGSKKTVVNGYHTLYTKMCQEAGIDAVSVVGYTKRNYHNLGGEFYIPRSGLCVVYINGKWEFVEPVGGSGYVSHRPKWLRRQLNKLTKNDVLYVKEGTFEEKYDPSYFMMKPEELRNSVIAIDPYWQLLSPEMSLNTFMMDDSAVAAINKQARRISGTGQHTKISNLEDEQQIAERAERTHAFNEHFWLDNAVAEQVKAQEMFKAYFNKPDESIPPKAVKNAINYFTKAGYYIDSQKKYISPYYTKLKKNNSKKHTDVKARLRKIKLNISSEGSAIKRISSGSNSKIKRLNNVINRNRSKKKELDAVKIKKIDTKRALDPENPLLVAIMDSIKAKSERIVQQKNDIDRLHSEMKEYQEKIHPYYNAYFKQNFLVDSFLRDEAYSMASLHYSYEKENEKCIALYNDAWESKTAKREALKEALDSVQAKHTELNRIRNDQFREYKGIIRGIEQYKRSCNKWQNINEAYTEVVNNYVNSINNHEQNTLAVIKLHEFVINNFETIDKAQKGNNEVVKFMEKIENKRSEIIGQMITNDRTYDEKEIEKFDNSNEKSLNKMKDILSKI